MFKAGCGSAFFLRIQIQLLIFNEDSDPAKKCVRNYLEKSFLELNNKKRLLTSKKKILELVQIYRAVDSHSLLQIRIQLLL